MHTDMSTETKAQVLARRRRHSAVAGPEYKHKLLDQAVGLLGYHRKAAIRALGAPPAAPRAPARLVGRPKTDPSETRLPVLKPIWFTAFQPCGSRLHALLPDGLPAYETDHRRLDADVRQALLAASARTRDRLVAPLRVALQRRGGTRPGNRLRQSLPLRGEWTEAGPGWLELDPVARGGGRRDDRHLGMRDAVDIRTAWTERRALENRGQHCPVTQIRDREASLPFALLGGDRDNGGEFINHHLGASLGQRPKPVLFPRSRPYQKNDTAHVEQPNWTPVRQPFGYARDDHPGGDAPAQRVVPRAAGAVAQPLPADASTPGEAAGGDAGGAGLRAGADALCAGALGAGRDTGQDGRVAAGAWAAQSVPVGPGGGAPETGDRSSTAALRLNEATR